VIKAKKDYYNACKQDRAASVQENTLRGVADATADQVLVCSCYVVLNVVLLICKHPFSILL